MKYWNQEGQHQAEYNRLIALLVPDTGDPETEAGRFLQLASNIYYDVYNNGGGNLDEGGGREFQMFTLFEIMGNRVPASAAINLRKRLQLLTEGRIECDDKYLGELLDSVIDAAVLAAQEQEARTNATS